MSKASLTIEVDLVVCDVGFTVLPGETILVWNGRCLGKGETTGKPKGKPSPITGSELHEKYKSETTVKTRTGETLTAEDILAGLPPDYEPISGKLWRKKLGVVDGSSHAFSRVVARLIASGKVTQPPKVGTNKINRFYMRAKAP